MLNKEFEMKVKSQVMEAEELLTTTNLSYEEIAARVGMSIMAVVDIADELYEGPPSVDEYGDCTY